MEVVTQDMVRKAVQLGACRGGVPKAGVRIDSLSFDQMSWAADKEIVLLKPGDLPLWARSGDGSGYGYGYGDGYGSGYGDGYGYGYG